MIKGPFLAHSVYLTNNVVYIGDSVFMNAETFARQSWNFCELLANHTVWDWDWDWLWMLHVSFMI